METTIQVTKVRSTDVKSPNLNLFVVHLSMFHARTLRINAFLYINCVTENPTVQEEVTKGADVEEISAPQIELDVNTNARILQAARCGMTTPL